MATYQFEVDGETYEFDVDDGERSFTPQQQIAQETPKVLGSEKIGTAVMETGTRPGAANRAALLGLGAGEDVGQAYQRGVEQPESVPTFADLGEQGFMSMADPLDPRTGQPLIPQNIRENPIVKGVQTIGASGMRTAGQLADIATNPLETALAIGSIKPIGMIGGAVAKTPVGKVLGEALTKKRNVPFSKEAKAAKEAAKAAQEAKLGIPEEKVKELSGMFSGKKRREYLTSATRSAEDADLAEKARLATKADEIKAGSQTKLSELEKRQAAEESSRVMEEQRLMEKEADLARQQQDRVYASKTERTKQNIEATRKRQDLKLQEARIEEDLANASRRRLPEVRAAGKELYKQNSDLYDAGVKKWMQSAEANNITITRKEMLDYLTEKDPYRPDDVQALLRDMFPEATSTQALKPIAIYQHIEDASRNISRRAKEIGDFTWSNHLSNEKKWALLDMAERKGATGVAEAKAAYAEWAPTRKRLINDIGIFRSNTEELDRGTKFLVKLAKNPQGDPHAFIRKVEELAGTNFSDDLVAQASKLTDVQKERAAIEIRKVLMEERRVAEAEAAARAKTEATAAIKARREALRSESAASNQRYVQQTEELKIGEQRQLADVTREKSVQAENLLKETRRIQDVKSELTRRVWEKRIKTIIGGIIADLLTGKHIIGYTARSAASVLSQ